MTPRVQLLHAQVWDGYEAHERPLNLGSRVSESPDAGARKIDLSGYLVFPGLVNAHDHLELNHYPRTRFREVYGNAHQWGEDVSARLNQSPFRELQQYPLEDRLFVGGLKNLLCGATTVAHHNPLHRPLRWQDFPVRVLQRYGWAHSLHFDHAEQIRESYRRCARNARWFIHLAEGTDEVAAAELNQLHNLGCLGENTVLIHGVGVREDWFWEHPSRLVWCPSTNLYLLGKTLDAAVLESNKHIALGSDSRLTADGDLLDELRAACTHVAMTSDRALRLVTSAAGRLIGLDHVGHLKPGAAGDWIVLKDQAGGVGALCSAKRSDLALIVRGGVPLIGEAGLMAHFPHISTVAAILDGVPRSIHAGLARRISLSSVKEPGLEIDEEAVRPRPVSRIQGLFRSRSNG